MANTQKQQPAAKIRIGAIQAAIWENETANGSRFNVTLSRLYKDQKDDWKNSSSFGRDDLLLLAKIIDRAHDVIYQLQKDEKERRE